jgi:hypothetical protein
MPQVNGAFIGAGQFGSTRNADAMGRAAQAVQDNITGAQANALESGYRTSADIFGADAGRQIQAGTQLGALGQLQQQLGSADASLLAGLGGVQQQQQQRGLDTAYQDWQTGQNYDMTQLQQLRQLISGLQLPAGSTAITNSPTGGYGASPLDWMGALINGIPTGGFNGGGAPAPAPAAGTERDALVQGPHAREGPLAVGTPSGGQWTSPPPPVRNDSFYGPPGGEIGGG